MVTYVGPARLYNETPGAPASKDAWGDPMNSMISMIQEFVATTVSVNINGLTSYSLTTKNNQSDQARPLRQSYTGALAANCTVTIPDEGRIGWAVNNTTGGKNVLLNAGAGADATIPPDGANYLYVATGGGAVNLLGVGFSTVIAAGTIEAGTSLKVGTSAAVGTTLSVGTNITAGGNITGGGTLTIPGAFNQIRGGLTGFTAGSGTVGVSFAPAFATSVVAVVMTSLSAGATPISWELQSPPTQAGFTAVARNAAGAAVNGFRCYYIATGT